MQTQEVSTTKENPIRSYLEANEKMVVKVLAGSKVLQAKALIDKFLLAVHQNDKLKSCTRMSLLNSLLFCAEKGLSPTNGKIVLVPYGAECQATIGVPGIRELIRRNPDVKRVGGDVVRAKDDFKLVSGLEPTIHHVPHTGEDSEIIGSYAFAELISGGYIIRYCSHQDIMTSKAASKGSASPHSPWNKFFSEMARIVPLRKLAKELIVDEITHTFDTTYEAEVRSSSSYSRNSNNPETPPTIDHDDFKNDSYDYTMGEAT